MSESLDLVEKLNIKLYDSGYEEGLLEFTYTSNGSVESIEFTGIRLWDSESDGREWLEVHEEYEALEGFILRKFRELSVELTLISILIGGYSV